MNFHEMLCCSDEFPLREFKKHQTTNRVHMANSALCLPNKFVCQCDSFRLSEWWPDAKLWRRVLAKSMQHAWKPPSQTVMLPGTEQCRLPERVFSWVPGRLTDGWSAAPTRAFQSSLSQLLSTSVRCKSGSCQGARQTRPRGYYLPHHPDSLPWIYPRTNEWMDGRGPLNCENVKWQRVEYMYLH